MKTFNLITILFLSILSCNPVYADVSGTKIQGPALVEGFNEVATAAGTTTLTKDSQTKQIFTGSTTQTVVLPNATTLPLSRKFLIINKSTGTLTIQSSGGGALGIISTGKQKEFHLRAAGSAAGTWDELDLSGGGGGSWGSITGTLSDQTDLQAALDLKAPLANPTFSGNITTPLTASRLLTTNGSSQLSASSVTATEAGYLSGVTSGLQSQLDLKAPLASPTFSGTITTPLTASRALTTNGSSQLAASSTTATELGYVNGVTSAIQTQLDAKQARSTLTTKGDLYVATASATTARQAVGSNGETILADSDMTNGIRYGTPVGTDNYIKSNPSFESNTVTGWTTYADSGDGATTQPANCTGGSPNTTFAANASAPILNGSYQGLATLSTGATRQAEGFSYAFSIPTKYSASPGVHQIEFDYAISGGTFVAGSDSDRTSAGDSTFTVWVYDVTNSQLIQPSTYRLYSTTGGKFVANFQNNSGSTSYRLCVHKGTSATVSGSNITVKFDDFRLFPAQYTYGTPITDWQSCTPTFTAMGTVSSVNVWSRRVGDSLEMQGRFVAGTTSASEGRVSFCYGSNTTLTSDATKIAVDQMVGQWWRNLADASVVDYSVLIKGGGITYANISTRTASIAPYNYANGNQVADSGGVSGFQFSVPITGWSSSTQVSDGFDGRLISLTRFNQTTQSINSGVLSIVDFPVASVDTTSSWRSSSGAFNSTTGVFGTTNPGYVVPSSGLYRVSAGVRFQGTVSPAANSNLVMDVYVDGVAQVLALGSWQNGGSAGTNIGPGATGSATISVRAGQVIDIRITHSFGSAGVLDNNARTYLSIEKLQSPQTMSATEVVAARYKTNTATSIPNTGVFTLIDFEDSDSIDTHGAVTTGASWKFTAPVSGLYRVSATLLLDTTSWTAGNAVNMRLFKNGSAFTNLHRFSAQASTSMLGHLNGSAIINLNAGDYVDIRCAGNQAVVLFNDNTFNHINIERIK